MFAPGQFFFDDSPSAKESNWRCNLIPSAPSALVLVIDKVNPLLVYGLVDGVEVPAAISRIEREFEKAESLEPDEVPSRRILRDATDLIILAKLSRGANKALHSVDFYDRSMMVEWRKSDRAAVLSISEQSSSLYWEELRGKQAVKTGHKANPAPADLTESVEWVIETTL